MNIHIVNFFGTRNKGDELMLRGLIGELKRNGYNNITVSTYFDKLEDSQVLEEIKVFNSISTISKSKSGKFIVLLAYLLMRCGLISLAKKICIMKDNSLEETFKCIDNSDLILTTGGPFFNENVKKKVIEYPTFNYITSFIELLYGLKKGIPFSIIGQSFGKIKFRISKHEFKYILSNAYCIAGRESYSVKDILNSLNSSMKINVIPDLGLSESVYNIKLENREKENLICVNVRGMNSKMLMFLFSNENSKEYLQDKYENIIASSLSKILSEYKDFKVAFINQAIMDDIYISERIAKKANLKNYQYEIIDDKISLENYINILSKSKFAITTRYHSMIMSILVKTSFVSLAYSEKIVAALYDYGMEQNIMNGENFTSNNIYNRFVGTIENNNLNFNERNIEELRKIVSSHIKKNILPSNLNL